MAQIFSAIIPLHNKSATIARAMRSILTQTTSVSEIIVVDDCSTDGSISILQSLAVPNTIVVRRDTPGPGGYAARNLGVESARTEWVGFLDADDKWYSDHLASAADIIQKNPNINAIFFGRRIQKNGLKIRSIIVPEARIYHFPELIQIFAERNVFHINSLVIRRDAYLAIGGFQTARGWRRGGDSEFFLRLIRDIGSVYVTPKITSLHDMNFSEIVGNSKNFNSEHPIQKTVEDTIRTHPNSASALKRLANRKIVEWLREMPNDISRKKLSLLTGIYPLDMTIREWYKLFRDFNR